MSELPKPVAGPPRPFHPRPVRAITLDTRIVVYFVEQHALPILSLDLNMDGGSVFDPPGKEGLASLAMAFLLEGTARLDRLQFAEALADLASNIGGYATEDSLGLTLSSIAKHWGPTHELFVEVLGAPGFRAPDFDRLVKRRIESIRQSRTNPASIASRLAGTVLFGRDHPFGTVVSESSLGAITVEDCRAYAARFANHTDGRLFVVGDLDERALRARFENDFFASRVRADDRRLVLPPPAPLAARVCFVNVPGASQSQISLLHHGPRRDDPRYFATTLMTQVLGGGFTSRLNMNLRESKGYSYGARGGFSYSQHGSTFGASASVRADATFAALLEVDREVRELASGTHPITADELEREKQGAILALPGHFATAQGALGLYRRLVYFGLPLDYFDRYTDEVARVTLDEANAAARAFLTPEHASWLVVGDGETNSLRSDLERYVGAGGLLELDPDGNYPRSNPIAI